MAIWKNICFLAHHYLVNETGSEKILRWPPYLVHAGEFPLELFNQNHEIPNSKHMTFHKSFDIFLILDEGGVDRMGEECFLEWVNHRIQNSLHLNFIMYNPVEC